MRARPSVDTVLAGGGEMGALARAFDWGTTPLGPVARWSESLRALAGAVLNSRNPMLLFWGPDLIQLYNDAFRPSLGAATGPAARHPRALGARGREFWTDVWDVVGPQIEGVMQRGESVWFEDIYLPIERNGRMDDVWWTYSYSPVRDDDGTIGGTLVVCLETTQRVLAEQRLKESARQLEARTREAEAALDVAAAAESRLRDVFAQAPVGIAVLVGPTLVYDIANARYQEIIGGGRPLVGVAVRDAFPEVEGQGYFEHLERVYATGEPISLPQSRVLLDRDRDGVSEEYFYDLRFEALRRSTGAVYAVVIIAADVTDLVRARREAESANAAKGQFLAVMSHELRTPLNAIGGYAELLALGVRGPVTAEQIEDLERIRRSQRHLLGLINEVLNYARLEAGAVTYDLRDVVVCDALRAAEGLVAPQARLKGLTLTVSLCPETVTVRADAEKLRQILVNLLSNAVKYTNTGAVEVEVAWDERTLGVTVRDTGVGIASDKLASIFEPFVQVGRTLHTPAEGTGLGLAISRDLARGMGGDLTVASVLGQGSSFVLVLPRSA